MSAPVRLACAIYTRKSSEEGLEQSFNSIDAQREACEAYIRSQRHEGWKVLETPYDDGGFSGGNMERPGLQRLMHDIAIKRIQVVVVYKVDRLTRSLTDFARMVEQFDTHGVSFVSVTQQFNTTSSMGRLTLNVLLSFAQFEREVTGERIRDKIAASKAKGLWMGGIPPLGYVPRDRTLVIDEEAAQRVNDIFRLYLELGSVRSLKDEIDRRGWLTPARTSRRAGQGGNRPFSRGHLYRILSNPVYIGQIAHKGKTYPGQHAPIIERATWDAVQARLADNRQGYRQRDHVRSPSLLAGLLQDEQGNRLTPSHSKKGSRRYRYYVSERTRTDQAHPAHQAHQAHQVHQTHQAHPPGTSEIRIPAHELEQAVMKGLVRFLRRDTDILKLLDARAIHDAHRVHASLERAHAWAKAIDDCTHTSVSLSRSAALPQSVAGGSEGLIGILQALIRRIIIGDDYLEIGIRLAAILQGGRGSEGGHEGDGREEGREGGRDEGCEDDCRGVSTASGLGSEDIHQDVHTLLLPVQLKRSGRAMRLIVPGLDVPRGADPRLVQLLSRAYDWFDRLASGKAGSMQAIATQEEVTSSYVTRVVYLAFLAPDIVRVMLEGRQPDSLTPDSLMRRVPLPIDWTEQRRLLGFPS